MRNKSPHPLPKPGASWDELAPFADGVDGYAYAKRIGREGEEWFEESFEQFKADGALPDDPDALMAILGLAFRWMYWTSWGSSEPAFQEARPMLDEILRRLNSRD